jgi:hypothetical protein
MQLHEIETAAFLDELEKIASPKFIEAIKDALKRGLKRGKRGAVIGAAIGGGPTILKGGAKAIGGGISEGVRNFIKGTLGEKNSDIIEVSLRSLRKKHYRPIGIGAGIAGSGFFVGHGISKGMRGSAKITVKENNRHNKEIEKLQREKFQSSIKKVAVMIEKNKERHGHGGALGAGIVGGLAGDIALAPVTAPITELVNKKLYPAVGRAIPQPVKTKFTSIAQSIMSKFKKVPKI